DADHAATYERQAFDFQYADKKFEDAAGTANELARIYLESGDVDNAFQWYQTGHLTALLKPNMTPAEKDLWEFRWESALARVRARQGQKGKPRSISLPPRRCSTKVRTPTRCASFLTSPAMSRSTAK